MVTSRCITYVHQTENCLMGETLPVSVAKVHFSWHFRKVRYYFFYEMPYLCRTEKRENMELHISKREWEAMSGDSQRMLAYWENVFSDSLNGGLTEAKMRTFNPDQLTLLAYLMLRREMMEGGLLQLLYNGYGPFIFENPFAKAMRLWGLQDFSKFVYTMRRVYENCHEELEGMDVTEEEFMSLYEKYPEMESLDDDFLEIEPSVSSRIINFVMQSPQQFGVTFDEKL